MDFIISVFVKKNGKTNCNACFLDNSYELQFVWKNKKMEKQIVNWNNKLQLLRVVYKIYITYNITYKEYSILCVF